MRPLPRWILIFNSAIVLFVSSYSPEKTQNQWFRQIQPTTANKITPPPENLKGKLEISEGFTLLTAGGEANPYDRSFNALSLPLAALFGNRTRQTHLEIQTGLRYILQTQNPWTFVLHGTGTTGISAVLDNLIEPGDKVLIGVYGHWGEVASEIAERFGGSVVKLEKSPGSRLTFEEIKAGVREHRPKILYLVHGESSTGVLQPIDGIGNLCRRFGCLSVLDVVSTVGQIPIRMDERKIDVVLMNTQKGCGGVVGLAPVSFSPRAAHALQSRKSLPKNYQLEITSLAKVWSATNNIESHRDFLHGSSHPLLYMLREGLGHIAEEGIENVWSRHQLTHKYIQENAESLFGLHFFVPNEQDRLSGTYTFRLPEGKDVFKIEEFMFDKYGVELSPGMGPTLGKIIRFGLFGNNARIEVAQKVLAALKGALESPETNS